MNNSPANTFTCGIIIPVYNSTEYLSDLLSEIEKISHSLSDWMFNIVVVDDGSEPGISQIISFSREITLLRHKKNLGKGAALKTGISFHLNKNVVDCIMTIDSDNQHPPQFIPHFLKKFSAGNGDLIVGSRKRLLGMMPVHRILSNFLTSFLISLITGQHINDSQCGYRLLTRKLATNIAVNENGFHFESEMIIRAGWQGFKISFLSIPTIYNSSSSAINNVSDTLNFIRLYFRLLNERITRNVRKKKI